ncbi:MAG TPA: ABC transporter substrate-binding protein [Verrucomicrobiae bacterium]|nr:ABC transporter substrate-binding protein [Verrucomicrobiae bacterium]
MSWTHRRTIVAAAVAVASVLVGGTSAFAGAIARGPGRAASVGFQAQHAGGTLHLVWTSAAGTLDPQVNYTLEYWQLYQATYDGLVAFRKTTGAASFDIVPDLATTLPTVSNGGKTYVFTLRKGIKFSNGQPVTLQDVVASMQRLFKVANPNSGSWYSVLVGASACLKTPATCTLAGGVVADSAKDTVTFHLTQPDAEFLDQLAVPFGSILPADAPPHDAGTVPLPTTGPYYFKSYQPNSELTLVRNPYFHVWSAAAEPQGYPNKIVMTFGQTVESEVTAVENGQADWMGDPPPPDRLTELSSSKYAGRVHVNPLTAVWYLVMNTRRAPFNNLLARQAINWAVNRAAAVRLFGGSNLAQPACTILPPNFPGHVNFCDYTKPAGSLWRGPDLAKAKQLVKQSGTKGESVGVVVQNDTVNKSIGEYVQSVLNQIGYKATLKPLSANIQFTYIQNTNNHVQISLSQWYQDYPAASDFLRVLLSCSEFHPGSDNSINIAGYCNPALDRRMAAAETLSLSNPTAANRLWGKIDEAMMQQAPWAPLFTPKLIDFVSSRVRHYEFSRQFYMLVDQLWLK